jgi:hypothetical protein
MVEAMVGAAPAAWVAFVALAASVEGVWPARVASVVARGARVAVAARVEGVAEARVARAVELVPAGADATPFAAVPVLT